jgi:hypothetical protein
MANVLTGTKVRATYTQLLHVDGGVDATERPVLTGSGTPTAASLSTNSLRLGNVRLQGNAITPVTGALSLVNVSINGGSIANIEPLAIICGGTGAGSVPGARANLGLGSMALQDSANVNISGGTFAGSFVGSAFMSVISDKRYGQFYSLVDQTAVANTPTVVTFDNSAAFNNGLSLATSSTVSFTTTGVYMVTASIQFANADTADRDATLWFRRDGTDVPASASVITIPKANDGGAALPQVTIIDAFTAGQTLSLVWAPEVALVTLAHSNAQTSPFAAPAIPSVILTVVRIA